MAVWLLWLLAQQLVNSCNDGARRMERTEQMYTIQKQMEFGKIKVRPQTGFSSELLGGMLDEILTASAAISSGVIITVAEEARRACSLHGRAQHLEGFQPQELLPVSLQRCPDHHQEEKVRTWNTSSIATSTVRGRKTGHVIKIGTVGEEYRGSLWICVWAFPGEEGTGTMERKDCACGACILEILQSWIQHVSSRGSFSVLT